MAARLSELFKDDITRVRYIGFSGQVTGLLQWGTVG